MHGRDILSGYLHDMEDFAMMKGIKCPPLYLLGGSACILAGYLDRATTDFDLIDMDYPSSTGRLLKLLEKFDLLDYYVTPLSPDFRERAVRLDEFKHLEIYVLSREDVIVSKLSRFSEKDIEDIRILIGSSDKSLVYELIYKVLKRDDFSPRVKPVFEKNSKRFMEDFYV